MHNNDSENIRRQWLQENEKVCICKGIPHKIFIRAIKAGALSIQEINRSVGSGSGDCNGERCGPKIEQLLKEYQAANKK
jgi:bacterioferritin-associated ferredoxin